MFPRASRVILVIALFLMVAVTGGGGIAFSPKKPCCGNQEDIKCHHGIHVNWAIYTVIWCSNYQFSSVSATLYVFVLKKGEITACRFESK